MNLLSIQYLRAIAAFSVVAYHLGQHMERVGAIGHGPAWLAGGVDVFFVISGCIMWVTTARSEPSPTTFYWNRISRIVPLYYILTTAKLTLMLAAPGMVDTTQFALGHVIGSYLFFPVPNPTSDAMEPLLFPGWTLNYEMFFYLIFGACLLLPQVTRMAVTLSVLTCLVILGAFLPVERTALAFYTSSILLEFALGMVLGWLLLNTNLLMQLPSWLLGVAGLAGLVALGSVFPDASRLVLFGLPAVLIVAAGLGMDQRGAVGGFPALRLLGDASYSTYLTHGFVVAGAAKVAGKLGLFDSAAGCLTFCTIALVAVAMAGLAVHLIVEKPLIALFRHRGNSRVQPLEPAVPSVLAARGSGGR